MKPVALREGNVFVKKKHELADLMKQVERVNKDAIDLIAETMNTKDEKIPLKVRLECARWLLEFQKGLSDQISRDELMRLVAEVKANGLKTPLVPEEGGDGKPLPPRLDMNTIQSV